MNKETYMPDKIEIRLCKTKDDQCSLSLELQYMDRKEFQERIKLFKPRKDTSINEESQKIIVSCTADKDLILCTVIETLLAYSELGRASIYEVFTIFSDLSLLEKMTESLKEMEEK